MSTIFTCLKISLHITHDTRMRYLLVFIITSFISSDLHSQTYLGIKVGGNITSINYDQKPGQPVYSMDQKLGYIGGLVFQHFANKNFGIQAEIDYVQKGWLTAYDTTFNTQYERSINYLDIPFLTHFYFGTKKTKFLLQLGFFVGYALSSTETFYDADSSEEKEYIFNPENDNRIEYGLQGGAGIKREFGFGTIQLEGNYTFTLNSLYKWGYATEDIDFKRYFDIPEQAQSTGIQITLSYLYPINKGSNN